MKTAASMWVLIFLLGGGWLSASSHPNIVYILADDMSYDSVSAYNPKIGNMKTPHIDHLVDQGMSFSDAHSGSAVCTPTRYGILTGRYCWRSRLKNSVLWEWGKPLIEEDRLTVAQMLKDNGYVTGIIGKWHLGMNWYDKEGNLANHDIRITDSFFKGAGPAERVKAVEQRIDFSKPVTGGPLDHGFDEFFGLTAPNFPPYVWIKDRSVQALPTIAKPDTMFGHPGPMVPGWTLDAILPRLAAEAAAWITERSKTDQPFFLYLPLTSPHTPIEPSAKFLGTSGISKYADFVIETDWVVGHVMEALKNAEVTENTLLIFTTDNGTSGKANFKELESHGVDLHHHFKGHKAQIHEGGHRIPFIVRWPERIKAASTCSQTICQNDFMATVADLLNVRLPHNAAEDSTSILPLLTGQASTLPDHPMVVNHDIGGNFAIRNLQWKLVASKKPQLFDLKQDPKETTNVATDHPEVVAEMTATLAQYKSEGRSTPMPEVTPTEPTSSRQRLESWDQHVTLKETSPFKDMAWRHVGPSFQGGRVESVASPVDDPYTLYVGVGAGNLWKTTNQGVTWKPIFEQESTFAIGCVAVSQSDPNILYVGTGEPHLSGTSFSGTGLFKSKNAGETWQNVGLHGTQQIAKVVIHPQDPQIVYVAAVGHMRGPNQERGIFKTTNGGETWGKSLFIDDQVRAIDMVMDPSDPKTLYATFWDRGTKNSGIYRTVDAGHTWQQLKTGLPLDKRIGRIAIDVSVSDPNVLYSLMVDHTPEGNGRSGVGGLVYRSDDKGNTWQRTHEDYVPTYVGWDFCDIKVSPDNEDMIYICGFRLLISTDGGKHFERAGETVVRLLEHEGVNTLHLDHHDLWIDPSHPDRLVLGNDGGLFISYDRGQTWLHINNLPIAEFYNVSVDNAVPYNIYGGTQDNAALYGPSDYEIKNGTPDPWQQIFLDPWAGGDAFATLLDPVDANLVYYVQQNGDMHRKRLDSSIWATRKNTANIRPRAARGEPALRFAWNTPMILSSHQPYALYCGANKVFKSTNRGDNWTCISPSLSKNKGLLSLSESPMKPGVLYAGGDNGTVHVSQDDGALWQDISQGLPKTRVTRVLASQHQLSRAYVTLSHKGASEYSPYMYRTNDDGQTWQRITGNLPLESVNVIVEDPRNENTLYIGTDMGVYVSMNQGKQWHSLCNHIPSTPVVDMVIHPRDFELVAATHGRSIFVLDVKNILTKGKG